MNDREFAVGDKVYVDTGGYGMSLSGPFTIEKQHKNGNLIVNGMQFRKWGSSCAGSRWTSRAVLLLADSPEHLAALAKQRKRAIYDRLHRLSERVGRRSYGDDVDFLAADAALDQLCAALKVEGV